MCTLWTCKTHWHLPIMYDAGVKLLNSINCMHVDSIVCVRVSEGERSE